MYETPVGIARNLHLPLLKKIHFSYKTKNCFVSYLKDRFKIEGPILSYWIRYVCVAQRKFENQGRITEVKVISALINDWENIIAYWEESKQSEAFVDKCNSLYTVNS